MTIGEAAEVPAADGPDQEADGVDARHFQQLRGLIALWEEAGGEVQRR